MTKVMTGATMSLDGFIAGPEESGFDLLFRWYGNGDVEVPSANPNIRFRLNERSAALFKDLIESTGVLVVGRRLFDITNGWDGMHPMGVPVIVVTHNVPDGWPRDDAPFTFVTEGIEAAISLAKEMAGDKTVVVNGGTIARQCLDLGLLDEIGVDLAPVLLGSGTPFFGQFANAPVELEGPEVVEEKDVTHLRYRVIRRS